MFAVEKGSNGATGLIPADNSSSLSNRSVSELIRQYEELYISDTILHKLSDLLLFKTMEFLGAVLESTDEKMHNRIAAAGHIVSIARMMESRRQFNAKNKTPAGIEVDIENIIEDGEEEDQ